MPRLALRLNSPRPLGLGEPTCRRKSGAPAIVRTRSGGGTGDGDDYDSSLSGFTTSELERVCQSEL